VALTNIGIEATPICREIVDPETNPQRFA